MKQDISYEDLGHLGYLSQVHSLFLNEQQSFITILMQVSNYRYTEFFLQTLHPGT